MGDVFKKTDRWVVVLLLAVIATGLLLVPKTVGSRVVVRLEGQPVQTLSLETDGVYSYENRGISLQVEIKNRTAAVVATNCADRLCAKAGVLRTAGQTAVCLPAAFSLTVEGSAPTVDGVTY